MFLSCQDVRLYVLKVHSKINSHSMFILNICVGVALKYIAILIKKTSKLLLSFLKNNITICYNLLCVLQTNIKS